MWDWVNRRPLIMTCRRNSPAIVEGGDQVVRDLLRCRALATWLADMGRPHDTVRTSSPRRAGGVSNQRPSLANKMWVALTLMWAQFVLIMAHKFMRKNPVTIARMRVLVRL